MLKKTTFSESLQNFRNLFITLYIMILATQKGNILYGYNAHKVFDKSFPLLKKEFLHAYFYSYMKRSSEIYEKILLHSSLSSTFRGF